MLFCFRCRLRRGLARDFDFVMSDELVEPTFPAIPPYTSQSLVDMCARNYRKQKQKTILPKRARASSPTCMLYIIRGLIVSASEKPVKPTSTDTEQHAQSDVAD